MPNKIARDCSEEDMDEAIAEKVNQITKIVIFQARHEGMRSLLLNKWRKTRQIWMILSHLCKILRMTAQQAARILFSLIVYSQV